MRTLIIGRGNLGRDLERAFRLRGGSSSVSLLPYNGGQNILNFNLYSEPAPDIVFLCNGGFSVEPSEQDPSSALFHLLHVPVHLRQILPAGTTLVCFSSNYAEDPSLSLYARLQRQKEILLNQMAEQDQWGRTFVFRVANLYGNYLPLRGFPGKLVRRIMLGETIERMATNDMKPTHTRWLAECIAHHHEELLCHYEDSIFDPCSALYPSGETEPWSFANHVARAMRDLLEPSATEGGRGTSNPRLAQAFANMMFDFRGFTERPDRPVAFEDEANVQPELLLAPHGWRNQWDAFGPEHLRAIRTALESATPDDAIE